MDTAKKLALEALKEVLLWGTNTNYEKADAAVKMAEAAVAALSTPAAADAPEVDEATLFKAEMQRLEVPHGSLLDEPAGRSLWHASSVREKSLMLKAFKAGRALSKPSAPEPVAMTDTFVQPVPDKCDRIIWRNQYLHLSTLAASQPAPVEAKARPDDDALWDQTLKERDDYHEWADQLAARIATITGVDIGEHSSANCPWRNAVDAADEFTAPVEPKAGFTSQEIIGACDAAGIDDRAFRRLMAALKSTGLSTPVQAQAVAVPDVSELLVLAVECGVIRLSQVMNADLQDALTAFASRLAAAPTPSKGEAE